MEESSEPKQFLEALARWRESCIFYFKFDLALIAAVAAMVSFFKLEGDDLLRTAAEYKVALHCLVALLIYAIVFEACITNTSNRKDIALALDDENKRVWIYRWFKWGYELQVLAHALLLVFSLGYASGFVDSFMVCRTGVPGCGT